MDISQIGYQPLFDNCRIDDNESFEGFRHNSKYAFACANGEERVTPDYEALAKAFMHNPSLTTKLFEAGKPRIGYEVPTDFFTPDTLDCRHIMSLTQLFSHLRMKDLKVVEIGGGFGNWARLAFAVPGQVDCAAWTIIDIPAMIKLQKWYLGQISPSYFEGKIHFIDTDVYSARELSEHTTAPDVVIGAHSLSEIPMDIFDRYYADFIKKSEFLYYSTHNERPHIGMINAKLQRIERDFARVNSISSEGGDVTNVLYRKTA